MPSRLVTLVVLAALTGVHSSCEDGACDADQVTLLQSPGAATHVIKDGSKIEAEQTASEQSAASSVNYKAVAAEYVAMTLFVVIGCGSAMGVAKESGWVLQVALTFGFAITALAYTIGHYSGGHINCAVTLALVLVGQCTVMQGLFNFAAQLGGAITGALILTAMCPEELDKTGGLGSNSAPEGRRFNAFVGEFMMTFLLVLVVLETAVNPSSKANREMAALAIGFAVFLAHSVLIPLDGCSINPTRSLGPALVRKFCYKNTGSFDDMWVFWAGPLLGATGAAFVSTAMMG